MSVKEFTVFLVDDNQRVLAALTRLLKSVGYRTKAYSSSEEFLHEHDTSIPGCVVLDLLMPGLNGLNIQKLLTYKKVQRPIIFLTGEGNISASVLAMKAGAIDFLLKPINQTELLAAIKRAEMQDSYIDSERRKIFTLLQTLTRRERGVLTHVVSGQKNKQIAASLGITEKN